MWPLLVLWWFQHTCTSRKGFYHLNIYFALTCDNRYSHYYSRRLTTLTHDLLGCCGGSQRFTNYMPLTPSLPQHHHLYCQHQRGDWGTCPALANWGAAPSSPAEVSPPVAGQLGPFLYGWWHVSIADTVKAVCNWLKFIGTGSRGHASANHMESNGISYWQLMSAIEKPSLVMYAASTTLPLAREWTPYWVLQIEQLNLAVRKCMWKWLSDLLHLRLVEPTSTSVVNLLALLEAYMV